MMLKKIITFHLMLCCVGAEPAFARRSSGNGAVGGLIIMWSQARAVRGGGVDGGYTCNEVQDTDQYSVIMQDRGNVVYRVINRRGSCSPESIDHWRKTLASSNCLQQQLQTTYAFGAQIRRAHNYRSSKHRNLSTRAVIRRTSGRVNYNVSHRVASWFSGIIGTAMASDSNNCPWQVDLVVERIMLPEGKNAGIPQRWRYTPEEMASETAKSDIVVDYFRDEPPVSVEESLSSN